MKKIHHNKVSFVLLILMIVWVGTLIVTYAIPSFLSAINFINDDTVKSAIIDGYANEYFIQTEVIYYILCNIIYTISLIITIIFSIMSIFKPNIISNIGIAIIEQNIILLTLDGWEKFFTNQIDTIIVDIKLCLCFIILVAIICGYFSFKKKAFFYLLLSFTTGVQLLNTIYLITSYIKYMNEIQMIFHCFNEIIIFILYWLLIIVEHKLRTKDIINEY